MMFKLKAIRVGKGIKQKDLAVELGVSPQYLNNIENGKVEPRRDFMLEVSKKLNCTPQELFFDE